MSLIYRSAKIKDLKAIISLLSEDELGQTREQDCDEVAQSYIDAFAKIDGDWNQYLMVLEIDEAIMGIYQLTLIPSLTFLGSARLQIEAVRVHKSIRGQNIGQKMIDFAINWGKARGAKIIQLTTNKERADALRFYEKIGFKATHEGMKLYLE